MYKELVASRIYGSVPGTELLCPMVGADMMPFSGQLSNTVIVLVFLGKWGLQYLPRALGKHCQRKGFLMKGLHSRLRQITQILQY